MDTFDIIVGVIGLLALAASSFIYWGPLFWRQIRRERPPALELMRRLYGADDRLMKSALGRITLKAAGDRIAEKSIDLLKTVRARIEFDICHGHFAERRDSDRIWSERAEEVFWYEGTSERPPITLANCSVMHEAGFVDSINRYFDGLKNLKPPQLQEFISDIKIGDGFVAPLQLLTGLLHYFQEDWKKIIDEFGEDTQRRGDPLIDKGLLRKLQTFIYDCWLLWGPSIPICSDKCSEWGRGGLSALQFGYGDENNSIELIGEKRTLKAYTEPISERSVLAYRARVKGRLKRAKDISPEQSAKFGQALQQAMSIEERHLVLDLQDRGGIEPFEGLLGHGAGTPYYSAYLWVLIVILGPDNKPIRSPDQGTWTSLIPFFEHGNIADSETSQFLRRQLAEKAVAAIDHICGDLLIVPSDLRFAYACAIDDSGCGKGLAYPVDAAGPSIKEAMIKAAETAPHLKGSFGSRNPILDFKMYAAGNNPFSSCKLPSILKEFYDDLKDRENEKRHPR